MRLDHLIQKSRLVSRRDAKRLLRSEVVLLNGVRVRSGGQLVDLMVDQVTLNGVPLTLNLAPRYYLLYKPAGYVSSHRDDGYPSLFRLLELERASELHIAGRLDADTTGLLLLTDDGDWSHKITHPKSGVEKGYRVTTQQPITAEMIAALEKGVKLHGEEALTLPAKVEQLEEQVIELVITEGRYHQVKRMLAAVGNRVVALHRYQVGNITLEGLNEGEYRPLTVREQEEIVQ